MSFRANSGTRIEDYTNNAEGRELSAKTTYFPRADSDPYDDRYDVLSMIRADRDHPVISYVKRLPFESTSYPAIKYLGKKKCFTGTGGGVTGTLERDSEQVPSITSDPQAVIGDLDRVDEWAVTDGKFVPFIIWNPPGHDIERPLTRHCGFIRSKGVKGDSGIVHVSCPKDKEHYAKGLSFHCNSLSCPVCLNNTALREGEEIEKRMRSYQFLKEKQGMEPGDLGHWVISPPQDFTKAMIQDDHHYMMLRRHVTDSLQSIGCRAGFLIFHPWRQGPDMWRFSPHFHTVCYGYLDTDTFRSNNPDWIIKKVHADAKVESIGQTAAYLLTHCGLGLSERDIDDIDLDLAFLGYMLPGLNNKNDSSYGELLLEDGDTISDIGIRYSDRDHEDSIDGKGRMVGDISDIDWVEWVKSKLFKRYRITYFGMVSHRDLRSVGSESWVEVRRCPHCGTGMRTYEGVCDSCGVQSTYSHHNDFRAFKEHLTIVNDSLEAIRGELRIDPGSYDQISNDDISGGMLSAISPKVSLMVGTDELRTRDNKLSDDEIKELLAKSDDGQAVL